MPAATPGCPRQQPPALPPALAAACSNRLASPFLFPIARLPLPLPLCLRQPPAVADMSCLPTLPPCLQYRPSSAFNSPHWTTNAGAPVWNNNNSLTVGDRGERQVAEVARRVAVRHVARQRRVHAAYRCPTQPPPRSLSVPPRVPGRVRSLPGTASCRKPLPGAGRHPPRGACFRV